MADRIQTDETARRRRADQVAALRRRAEARRSPPARPRGYAARRDEPEGRRRARLVHADRARVAREEAELAERRNALSVAADEERISLRTAELTIPEQCDRNAFTVHPRGNTGPIRVRRGVIHDPRFKVEDRLRQAADELEKLSAEAARLGQMRNCLAHALGDTGGGAEGDPDAARARIVAADAALPRLMARISDAKTVETPAGWRSARDAVRICVLDGMPLSLLAATRLTAVRERVRALLIQGLEELADALEQAANDRPRRRREKIAA